MLRDEVLRDLENKLARLINLRDVVKTTDLPEYRFGKQVAIATLNRRVRETHEMIFKIDDATERELATYVKNIKTEGLC